jgi:hypothetical protein
MKQPGVLVVLVIFVAAVSFVVASEEYKNGRVKTATLTGMNEVGALGDADGTGLLKFVVRSDGGRFCYELSVSNISIPTAASLNMGTRDSSGQPIAVLQPPVTGSVNDCVTLDADRIGDIQRNPANYYVNVQNAEFPGGAIRGQLR